MTGEGEEGLTVEHLIAARRRMYASLEAGGARSWGDWDLLAEYLSSIEDQPLAGRLIVVRKDQPGEDEARA